MPEENGIYAIIMGILSKIAPPVSAIAACITVYLTVRRPEELLVSFTTPSPAKMTSGEFTLDAFFFNRGLVPALISSVGVVVLYSRQEGAPRDSLESARPVRGCDDPFLYSSIDFSSAGNLPVLSERTGSLRIVPEQIRLSAEKERDALPAFAADAGKVSSMKVSFSWDANQFRDFNAVAVCPFVSFYDKSGRNHGAVCRGWQRITIVPRPGDDPTVYGMAGGVMTWPNKATAAYKLLPAVYSDDESMPNSAICSPVDPFPDQVAIAAERKAETSIGIPP